MNEAVVIRTERLVLRPLRPADTPDVLAYRGSADVCRYLTHEPRDEAAVAAFIADVAGAAQPTLDGQHLNLGIESQGHVIGDVSLGLISATNSQADIGWVLNPAHQGQGYATEAANAMLRVAFDDMAVHRVFAELDPRNESSARLCERLGMRKEAHLRQESWFKGEWGDLAIYAILASEWSSRGSG